MQKTDLFGKEYVPMISIPSNNIQSFTQRLLKLRKGEKFYKQIQRAAKTENGEEKDERMLPKS